VLELVAQVPTLVWGRDELGTGEMWNSNSVIAWVIARSRIDAASVRPPAGGRPPDGTPDSSLRADSPNGDAFSFAQMRALAVRQHMARAAHTR
jgi:hypothetical protein